LVTVGTVTAQLVYEIAEPSYLNPDVITHFDTVQLTQQAPDRIRISGTRGSAPTDTLKVAVNYLGGYRNTMTLVVTGLDIAEKAAWAEQQLFDGLGGRQWFAEVDTRLIRFDREDAPTNEEATAHLRVTVKDPDPHKVGRAFSSAVTQLAVAGYAGFHTTTPPTSESAYGVYWPTLVPAHLVEQVVVLADGSRRLVPHTSAEVSGSSRTWLAGSEQGESQDTAPLEVDGPTRVAPLGLVCGARSGDKGGNANIGLWARDAARYAWLRKHLTVDRLRELLPEAATLPVHRYDLPNLHALNFVVVGLLGAGVAASSRPDPQAKGLGEYLRSRQAARGRRRAEG
jgi:hypothetical protein